MLYIPLELDDPSLALGDFLVQLTDLTLQLFDNVHIVALLKIKLAYPNFMFADTVLVFPDFVFFLIDLRCQLIVLFNRFVVLPTNIITGYAYSASSVHIVL